MNALKLLGTSACAAIVAVVPAFAQVAAIGPGEGQLNIVAWAGYIERGETDKSFDWVTRAIA